ncbi:MAG: 6-bladed beta-propeller [Tannerella sp.]|jgi:hypothetical protein|nr:6-bladed beta-propeller [Tannerella sp.]
MKGVKLLAALSLMMLINACKEKGEVPLPTIDVNAKTPVKELVLQDFLDVEYVPLGTTDAFVTQGMVMAIDDKYIVAKNYGNDGDIFIFDRKTGKALRKINRLGQGSGEYTSIGNIILDEANGEMFVNDVVAKKVLVYDLLGNFKRSFHHPGDTELSYMFNYDKDNLICYDTSQYFKAGEQRGKRSYHLIISKKDGHIVRGIFLPFDIIKAPLVRKGDEISVTSLPPITPYHDNWLLVDASSDTVYEYMSKENRLKPFLVKTPSKDPEILLTMGTLTKRYYFMRTIYKFYDFTRRRGFPIAQLLYDKQKNATFDFRVINGDYVKKQSVDMLSNPMNAEIAAFQVLPADKLVEAYKKGELKGKLKALAAGLSEDANPVLLLMKYK